MTQMAHQKGRAYSQDLRLRVLAASDRGMPARRVALTFGVSISYSIKVRQRRDRTGEGRALKPRQVQVRRLAGHEDALRDQLARKIDATLAELCAWLGGERGVQVGKTALWREPRRLGLTLKKVGPRRRAGPARQDRPGRIGQTSRPRARRGEGTSPALAAAG